MLAALLLTGAMAQPSAPPEALHITGRHDERVHALDCATDPCSAVLPEARRFEPVEGKPYITGVGPDDEPVGWVVLSTDVVDVKGYSSKPLFTLVGIDSEGVITGGRVVHHSEPILLVGIPESELHAFVDAHVGIRADERVVVGRSVGDAHNIDVVSGATVTVLAESRTILEAARVVAEDVGVIEGATRVPGHIVTDEPWSWTRMMDERALGTLVVTHEQMEIDEDPEGRPFIDLYFGIVDAPQLGIPLLGERTWKWAMAQLEPGEHAFVVYNRGASSFKGSGFVRGGLFDRFQLEQGLRTITFRDLDYQNLGSPGADQAPRLWEGGLFFVRDNQIDVGARYDLVFLGSSYALERGAFERDFHSFRASHRVPRSVYMLDGPDPDSQVWRAAWAVGWWRGVVAAVAYLLVIGLFVARRWTAGSLPRLRRIHTSAAFLTFFVLGLWLHVQPSVTQLLTLAGSAKSGWDWGLYLSDPTLFVSWIGIAVVTVLWGRGVFCGWLCPYGAMTELAFKLGRKLKLPEFELPDRIHNPVKYVRYAILFGLVAVFLYNAELGERLAEIEPFKSTFFVPLWTRHWALILWWVVLLGTSFTTYRPFCRYVCPLGAALALPSSFRMSGPYRHDFCSSCKICTRGCEPRAIRPDGTIDSRECLNCWECEANWSNDQVCPPLVRKRRDRERAA